MQTALNKSNYHAKAFKRYSAEPTASVAGIGSKDEMMTVVIDCLMKLYHGPDAAQRNAQLLQQIFNARRHPNHVFYMRFVCPAIILVGMPSFAFSCSNPCGRNTANCRILTEALARAAGIGNNQCGTPCEGGCDLIAQVINRYAMSTECPVSEQEAKEVERFLKIFNNVLEIATSKSCRITALPSGGLRPVETRPVQRTPSRNLRRYVV
jgi:hypothetical protein